MQSIQIIGTQRSGSNLLRLMLNQMPEIAAPHPPHILLHFFPLLAKYGNLNDKDKFNLLAADICGFLKANPVSWGMEDLLPSAVIARCKEKSLIALYTAVYELYAEKQGASMWCNKSMANLAFIPQIENAGLNPFYIHLVRDGRDVAASFRKAIVGDKHMYHLAKQGKHDQETAVKYCKQYAPKRYLLIYYEDLIHDTEGTMEKILERLGLHFNKEILNFYKTEEAQHTAEAGKMWNNVVRPVMIRNSNKFLTQLSSEDILIFESIAGDTLAHFGYKLNYDKSYFISSFSTKEIAAFDKLNQTMKAEATASLDPAGKEKREAQEAILQKIKQR